MSPPIGKFITLEGTEGVGKSTQADFVARFLRERGCDVIQTREPGGTDIAERIRKILLESEPGTISEECELLLMFAARASHAQDLIVPALARGRWVVCDRFVDATYAYQGAGRGIPMATIAALERIVLQGLRPDLTLLLEVAPGIADARRESRGVSDRFERENDGFFERVRQSYDEIAREQPERVVRIPAEGAPADVSALIIDSLEAKFGNHLIKNH